ncbi:MAG: ABC transporter ATP-binding protein [Flaviflexus sp.]|nr:ABC transporter ATP-binding protein [Flaviflexus sp.]
MDVNIAYLTYRYRSRTALADISLVIRSGTITGLLGRNGAGKSTLAQLIAGQLPSPHVSVAGEQPWDNPRLAHQLALITPHTPVFDKRPLEATARLWDELRPSFDPALFADITGRLGLTVKDEPRQLSRGMRAGFLTALGIASRAAVTIFDEATDGMDEVTRDIFYQELLADYARHPRTIIMATHLISETQPMMEDVIILSRGRLAETGPVDDVRERHRTGSLPSLREVLAAADGVA